MSHLTEEQKAERKRIAAAKKAEREAVRAAGAAEKGGSLTDEIAAVQLETARLNLEAAKEDNERRITEKGQKERIKQQRQADLRSQVANRKTIINRCSHRQGASLDNIYEGTGDSVLNSAMMPDGFTVRISCSVCRMAVFSPHPYDARKSQQPGETPAMRDARVAKYNADLEHFNGLLQECKNKKTREAQQMMHCGVTFEVKDSDNMPVYRRRPSDSYATAGL